MIGSKDLSYFYDELEDIATYHSISWDEDEFLNYIKYIKTICKQAKIDIPEEIKKTKSIVDFRTEMQKVGGYQDRREKIKEILYPLIDFLEEKETKDITNESSLSLKNINNYIKSNNYSLNTTYGSITNITINPITGGNGAVYFGKLNKMDVAIKFLLNCDSNKKNRFLCEFINIIMKIDNYDGIVKQYFYEEVVLDGHRIPIIVMKKYFNCLQYSETVSQDYLIACFSQIANALKKLHNYGIIHRDIKPKNILIDENGRLNIGDFGISFYNKDLFEFTGHTTKSERLANFDFSAPEQIDSKNVPTKSTDIYALGQIIQWLVFGRVHKGTNRKKITEKYPGHRMEILDLIVEKCLCNLPADRFQSIEEIFDFISKQDSSLMRANSNEEVLEPSFNITEIKDRIIDISNQLTTIEYNDEYGRNMSLKTFTTATEFNKETVKTFIENIPSMENDLLFYDEVVFSDYCKEGYFYNEQKIKKEYFAELYKLYQSVKKDSKLLNSFLAFLASKLNNNFELPF